MAALLSFRPRGDPSLSRCFPVTILTLDEIIKLLKKQGVIMSELSDQLNDVSIQVAKVYQEVSVNAAAQAARIAELEAALAGNDPVAVQTAIDALKINVQALDDLNPDVVV